MLTLQTKLWKPQIKSLLSSVCDSVNAARRTYLEVFRDCCINRYWNKGNIPFAMADTSKTPQEKGKRSAPSVNKRRQQEFVFKFPSQQEPKESVCVTSQEKDNEVLPGKNIAVQPVPPKAKRKRKKSNDTFVFNFKSVAVLKPDDHTRNTVMPKHILEKVKEDVRRQISNKEEVTKEIPCKDPSGLDEEVAAKGDCQEDVDLLQEFPCLGGEEVVDQEEKPRREDHGEGMDLLQELPCFGDEELFVGSSQQESKGKKKKKKRSRKWNDSKMPRKSPNYFISLPITNPKIHEDILTVQGAVVKSLPELEHACIRTPKLHLTLMVMHIDGDDQLQVGQSALEACKDAIAELMDPPLVLHVQGVSHFQNAVLYADLVQNEEVEKLKDITEKVRTLFKERDINPLDDRFTPHITILKLSKLKKRRGQMKKFPDSAFEEFVDQEFGKQVVESLKLCAMLKRQAEDGGYHVDGQIKLVPDEMRHEMARNINIAEESDATATQGSVDVSRGNKQELCKEDGKGARNDNVMNEDDLLSAQTDCSADADVPVQDDNRPDDRPLTNNDIETDNNVSLDALLDDITQTEGNKDNV